MLQFEYNLDKGQLRIIGQLLYFIDDKDNYVESSDTILDQTAYGQYRIRRADGKAYSRLISWRQLPYEIQQAWEELKRRSYRRLMRQEEADCMGFSITKQQ